MRNKLGTSFMMIGIVLMISALSLFLYNYWESQSVKKTSQEIVLQMKDIVNEKQNETEQKLQGTDVDHSEDKSDGQIGNETDINIETDKTNTSYGTQEETHMKKIEIAGYEYIGYLSIPILNLELPVMSEWDYKRLKISPCCFWGTIQTNDLAIAAHNYASHFGKLKNLSIGAPISFTDVTGKKYDYEVVMVEELTATDVSAVKSGNFALTLFTCTYGGKARVAVRCNHADITNW